MDAACYSCAPLVCRRVPRCAVLRHGVASAPVPASRTLCVSCPRLLPPRFAGVFLERMLKGTKTTLWVRNIQLCLFSVPLQLVAIAQQDYAAVSQRGLLGGFGHMAWAVVAINTGGGLLVAVVIKVGAARCTLALGADVVLAAAHRCRGGGGHGSRRHGSGPQMRGE